MKKTISLLYVSILLTCLFCCLSSEIIAKTPKTKNLDTIKVIVNNDVITQSELDKKFMAAKQQFGQTKTSVPSDKVIREKILENTINNLLQMQLAKRANYDIAESELDNAIENIAKKNNVTLQKLKQIVKSEGLDFTTFRKQIHDQMLIERIQHQLFSKDIAVTEQEITAFLQKNPTMPTYDNNIEYHLEDIVLPLPENPTADQIQFVKQQAAQFLPNIKQTTNFGEFAATYSTEKLKLQSTDLGWRRIDNIPEIFITKVTKMHPNEIIGPIMAANGAHILRLLATRGTNQQIKLTKEQAQEIIYRNKIADKIKTWLEDLRAKAYIKIL
jgi:peptidyl-prolyl cis-trans isomerase SurA